MGNIYSIFNYIYNETCCVKRKPKQTQPSHQIPICVISPLSEEYNIPTNYPDNIAKSKSLVTN